MSIEELKYPIGRAQVPDEIGAVLVDQWIQILEGFPKKLADLVENLDENQLGTPYREGGWTIRQVLHHLVDSHNNSYIRFKWTLTEDEPLIKAYYEERWAELKDSREAPAELALKALEALHAKWTWLLRSLDDEQLNRCFIHPEGNQRVSLKRNIGIYAWHSRHHYAHIENLMKRQGWI